MAITLRQIIASNAGATHSFRDQVSGCRNAAFFTGKNIRTLSAWVGFYYQLRTDSETGNQTRYSGWVCDVPAVNGRMTRNKYTDTRTRTRPVYSNGITGDWSEWAGWVQTAAVEEATIDGNTCPYITGTESESGTTTNYSGWVCDVPAVNGRTTRHRYDYIRHRSRDTYSNGSTGAWRDWGDWTLTADTVEQAWDGNACPYLTGTGTRHNYSGWSYNLPTGLGATGSRTRSHSITTWPTYSNGTTGPESMVGQPDESQSVRGTHQNMGSSYFCSGTYKQNYTIYRNAFAFSDTMQYSGNYNVNAGSPTQTPGYCGYVPITYEVVGANPRIVVDGPDSMRRAYITVKKTQNGSTTTLSPSLSMIGFVPRYNGREIIRFNGTEMASDPDVIGPWISDNNAEGYYTFQISISADGKTWLTWGLIEKRYGNNPMPWPPEL